VSTRALVDIYEHEGDFAGLAGALREQIETAPTLQERVTLLRKVLANLRRAARRSDPGRWAATEILDAVPGDRDTLGRLEGILERAGDARGLTIVLDQHVKHAASADRRCSSSRASPSFTRVRFRIPRAPAARWRMSSASTPTTPSARGPRGTLRVARQARELARILDLQVERVVADPAAQATTCARSPVSRATLRDIRARAPKLGATVRDLPGDAEARCPLAHLHGRRRLATSCASSSARCR